MAARSVTILAGVISRYVVGGPLAWSETVARYLFTWIQLPRSHRHSAWYTLSATTRTASSFKARDAASRSSSAYLGAPGSSHRRQTVHPCRSDSLGRESSDRALAGQTGRPQLLPFRTAATNCSFRCRANASIRPQDLDLFECLSLLGRFPRRLPACHRPPPDHDLRITTALGPAIDGDDATPRHRRRAPWSPPPQASADG
jgi:hypothetical protein